MTRNFIRPIFHKEDNPAHMTREDRREKDAAVAARHRAEGGTRYWCLQSPFETENFYEGREK